MDIKKALIEEHSKRQTTMIAGYIGSDPGRFEILMNLLFEKEYRIVQRAAWVLSYCGQLHPELINPYAGLIIRNLQNNEIPDAVKRNSLRILQFVKIPESESGQLVEFCYRFIYSLTEPIAVKAFSINILVKISRDYPELQPELILLLNEMKNHESPALRSCSKKGLKLFKSVRK